MKLIKLEINVDIPRDENSLEEPVYTMYKCWYNWNEYEVSYERHRTDGPSFISDRLKVWNVRGEEKHRVNLLKC